MNIPITIPINNTIKIIKATKANDDDKFYILAITVGVLTNDFPMADANGYIVTTFKDGVTNIDLPVTLIEADGMPDANGNLYYAISLG